MADQTFLTGYKVLDFTHALAGPTTTRLMAEMGAEVIKVEQAPNGDPARLTPVIKNKRSAYFVQHNLGKQGICVNLKTEAGREIIRALVPHMDVVVENYSPGVIGRMGFDYDNLKQLNPRLIMCSISVLGQTGPLSHLPGFDYIAQAYAGITEMIGEPNQSPVIPTTSMGDVSTGVHALAAIACALLHRERTGEGQFIDVSLLDAYIHKLDSGLELYEASQGQIVPTRGGAHHTIVAPCGVFKAAQGYILLIAILPHHWRSLTQVMNRPELYDDPRFRTMTDRAQNRQALTVEIEQWLQSFPDRASVLAALEKEHIPVAPVLTIPEVVQQPHFLERGAVRPISDRVFGTLRLPGFPFHFSATRESRPLIAPDLGEHNEAVLAQYLGYDAARVAHLTTTGVLRFQRTGE
ncbi:MAG: CaiB/BaiF CoA transferase family protein [Candidatus Binatia bacterium]